MPKSIVIIGAGMGGLSVGCYTQMNGYETQIFEMHDKAGGLCTAWKRNGYTIDGCLQWLWGSTPNHGMYRFWEELGVIQGQQIINMDVLMRIETLDGKVFVFYTNADRLEKHMKDIAPEDAAFIEEFTEAIRNFAGFSMPIDKAPELYSPLDYLSYFFKYYSPLRALRKWSNMTLGEMAKNFKNPHLRNVWEQIWDPKMSVFNLIMSLAALHNKSAGYPKGGSISVVRAVESRYVKLGGKIGYKKKVDKILVKDNRATGVRLADGTEEQADYVVSAADGHATIFEMLEGKYVDKKIRGYYEHFPVFPSLIFVGVGVNRSFEDVPQIIAGVKLELDKPLVIGGEEKKFLMVRLHNFDPTLAPSGKTVLTCEIESTFSYWETLRRDMKRYEEEKDRIAEAVISTLEKRFPGLTGQVEMRDVATPVTYYRYTGNWQGSYEGWLPTPQTPPTFVMSKTLPGLKNFYRVGQWVMPGGGLPSGVITGRWVTQMLCKADKKKFAMQKP